MRPELADVEEARERISEIAVRTPLVSAAALDAVAGSRVMLKMETTQPTGSFKIRGAASKIGALSSEEQARGVVAASTGNHGRAVAYVAARIGIPATICVSTRVPPGKVAALDALGCRVVRHGDSQAEALEAAHRLVAEEGLVMVHPFDDPGVIAGQGTIGLEILEHAPDVAAVVVPLSGGGLISGVALVVKARRPSVRVVGVSMERAPAMALSLEAGGPVEVAEEPTLADSLQGGIGMDNRFTFSMVRELVDQVVLVREDEIWEGMLWAFSRQGVVLEGGAAVGLAVLLADKVEVQGPTVVVCSGGNIETDQLLALGRGDRKPPSAMP